MSRQTYLSKDFFVEASENVAKDCILQLPKAVTNIKFIAEDPVRHSLKFVLEAENELPANLVNVALLPLCTNQTRITLHGSYADGTAIKEAEIWNTLQNFESAINAAVVGKLEEFQPIKIRPNTIKHRFRFLFMFSAVWCML